MLEYGINFNTEEGAKKALKEIEDWGKKWQAALSKNPLMVNFDGKGFQEIANSSSKLKKTATEINSIGEQLKTLRSQFKGLTLDEAKAGKGQDLINKYRALQKEAGIYAGTIDQAVKAQDKLESGTNKSTSAIERQNSAYKKQSEVLTQLKSYAMNFLSVYGGIRLAKSIVEITGEFEAQRMSLQAILMDAEKGAAIFERIKSLAVISPYTFKDLVSYTKQLSAFSVPYEELYDTTKMLADAAAGLGVDMSRLILAYGQVRSAAVLRGQELRQFTEAGIPLVDELAKKFTELKGEVVSASEVFDLISQRQVSFGMVKDIFAEMTGEGGKFYKMQEKLADTLKGKVSNLTDAFQIMLAEIGEKRSGVLKGAIDSTRWLMENYDSIGRILLTMVATYGAYKTALIAATALEAARSGVLLSQIKTLRLVVATQALLNKAMLANPYVIAAAGIVALATSIYLYTTRANAAERATKALNDQLEEQRAIRESEREELSGLIRLIKDETSTRIEKEQALQKLKSLMPSIFGDMDIESIKLANLTDANKLYNEQLENRDYLLRKQASKEANKLLADKSGDFRWSVKERQQALSLMGRDSGFWAASSINTPDLIKDLKEWAKQEESNLMKIEDIAKKVDVTPIKFDTFEGLKKSLKDAETTLKDLQEQAKKGIIPVEQIENQEAVIKKLKEDLSLMGWKEPTESEIKKSQKDAKDRVKDYLDGIQEQVEEYRKKFEIWDMIYQGTGKMPEINFDATFDGEPDLAKYIKSKMQEIGGGKLKLDIDFLTTGFSEILGDSKLDEQAKEALKKMFSDVQNIYISESKEIQSLYDKYASYIIKKQKLDETYQKERDKLVKSGASKDILDEQLNQYVESSNKLATEFAEQDLEFNKFVNEMAEKSIEELGNLLMKIDQEMSKMIDEGGDAETIAKLRARVAELEKLLRQKTGKSEKESKAADSYKDWKKLQTILSKVDKELQDIGDNIGGTAGEMVKFAGGITASTLKMINSIVELSERGILGIKMSATTAASAIKALESASVILAVISAVLQVYNAIKGLFDNKEQREYINKLEEDRNSIAREYNKILLERIALEDTLFGGNSLQNLVNIIKGYSEASRKIDEVLKKEVKVREFYAPGRYQDVKTSARGSLRIKTSTANWFQRNVLGRVDEYENLEEWVRKNLNTELFAENGWLNLDVAKDVANLSQIDQSTREILKDLISLQEAADEFKESIAEMIDDTFGELGSSLTDAIVEGFRNGSLAAEDFKNDVTSVLEDVAGQMVRMLYLQDFIDKYKDKLKKTYEDYAVSGDDEKYMEELMSSTAEFYGAASKAWGEASEFLTMFQDIGKGHGFDLFAPDKEDNLTGLSKAAASLTEDTALLLGGYLDSIRFKLFPYIDYMLTEHKTTIGDMLAQQIQMAAYLVLIEGHTRETAIASKQLLENISKVISTDGTRGAFAINVNT